jgi:putative transposase
MDGYSIYINHHELRVSMTELDVEIVVQSALENYPDKKPKLITDNGSLFISLDFQSYLKEVELQYVKNLTIISSSKW